MARGFTGGHNMLLPVSWLLRCFEMLFFSFFLYIFFLDKRGRASITS